MSNKYRILYNGVEMELERKEKDIHIGEYKFRPEIIYNGQFYRVFIDGIELKVEIKDSHIFLDGKEIDFDFQHAPTIVAKKGFQSNKGADIKAAIPGKIVDIKVKLGQEVHDQQCLLILESMKMRNEILSPVEGVIDTIYVNTGDQVVSKQILLKIKPKNGNKKEQEKMSD